MKYYCNPLNMEYRFQVVKNQMPGQEATDTVYREAADPSLVLFKGVYYLFPSMTAGFLTSDHLIDWKFHPFLNEMPIYDYAPDVRAIGEYLYFSASKRDENCNFYRTKNPLNEPFEEIKGTFPFWDPHLFIDNDGKVYFYWGCSNITPIYGVEMDLETMKPKTEPLVMFDSNDTVNGYERTGEDHVPKTPEEVALGVEGMLNYMKSIPEETLRQGGLETEEQIRQMAEAFMGNDPYIEGPWMTKHKGTYYLQYAIPGAEFNVYNDGVYTANHPLGPYILAKNNPYSYKPGGFINGAGHGSTLEDKNGQFWHTSTMSISINHNFERRIGLWKAGFDEDGELFCDQRYGDWPVRVDAKAFEDPEWMLLSYGKPVKVSSGTGAEKITNENVRDWWRGASNQPGEWAELDLGKIYDVRGIQINFAEEGVAIEVPLEKESGITPMGARYIAEKSYPTRWLLEGSVDGKDYFIVEDKSKVTTDLTHDFLVYESGIWLRYLRLTIKELPYNQIPCLSGIRVFGKSEGSLPKAVEGMNLVSKGDLDVEVSWEQTDAVGYNILWGYELDKLYHSYMIFGKCSQNIGALIKGEPVYFRIDSFNEVGITKGKVCKYTF